jgi:hypothetical protein
VVGHAGLDGNHAIAVAMVSYNSWASRSRFRLAGAACSAASSQLCVIATVLI